MTDAAPAAISLNGVSFAYGGTPALSDVTVRVGRGELFCIVGPNGGGKTTLLKLVLGLLQPDRGRVEVLGVDPVRARPRVGYVPQHWNFDLQFPVRVRDVVLMGRLRGSGLLSFYRPDDHRAVQKALGEVGLPDLEDRPFSALSGGQRQRVLIARALACEPEMLLLDEPTASVDIVAEEELHQLLHVLNRRMTIAVVTHDLGFVHKCVTRVLCVNRRVTTHETAEVTGATISGIYGHDLRYVRHDHTCLPGEHD